MPRRPAATTAKRNLPKPSAAPALKTAQKAPKKASKKPAKADASKKPVKGTAATSKKQFLEPAKTAVPRTFAQGTLPIAAPPAVAGSLPEAVRAHLMRPGESKTDWFARVAHDYYRFLYATALSITRNNDDAEDAVQSAVMNGLKRLDQLTEHGAVVSWLAMITRNTALDLLRRRKRTPGGGGDSTLLPLAAPVQPGDAEYQMNDDLRQVLAHSIATLPLSYQEVVNARHFRGLEVEDIAKDMGVTENNVRVRLFRAYEKLRESAQIRRALGLPPEKRD